MAKYIYESQGWPAFTWQEKAINALFGEVRNLQGRMIGQLHSMGFASKEEARLSTLTTDVMKSSEIEGEALDYAQVRSSIARKLGIQIEAPVAANRNVEGTVEMMLDATQNYKEKLSQKRLFAWHAALFPTGHSGMQKIKAGAYRTGEMQIVSGMIGNERIHYEAVPAGQVKKEMDRFLKWFNEDGSLDPVMKSGIAHFWFIIIHPFDDGNGRIARAISDMMLARAEETVERFYSMSAQIMLERKKYYAVLKKVQHSTGDITDWLHWYLGCLKSAVLTTEAALQRIPKKAGFWKIHENTSFNERQRLMLNKLLEGFEGKLKTSKWAKLTKCSTDTALRDIKELMEKEILIQENQGGRSTNYALKGY